MISSSEALDQLNRWKSASTKLFLWSLAAGTQVWCEGTLKHVSSGSLEFGRPEIAGSDFTFVVNLDNPVFKILDNRDASHFWSAGRKRTEFGVVIEMKLPRGAQVVFAEFFPGTIETPSR
jgi:hypothetical protein